MILSAFALIGHALSNFINSYNSISCASRLFATPHLLVIFDHEVSYGQKRYEKMLQKELILQQSVQMRGRVLCIMTDTAAQAEFSKQLESVGYPTSCIDHVSIPSLADEMLLSQAYDFVFVAWKLNLVYGKDVVCYLSRQYPDMPFVLIGPTTEIDAYETFMIEVSGAAGVLTTPFTQLSFKKQLHNIDCGFAGYDVDQQSASEVYAADSAQRLVQQAALLHQLAQNILA